MNIGALLTLVAAGLAAQEPASAPPRVRIAGQRSIHAVSRVVFTSAPDDPHQLATTLGFPDRVRTELSREGGRASERSLAYRFGAAYWTVAASSGESRPVPDSDREFVAFEFALRRALLLWPEGNDWSTPEDGAESGTRTAALAPADGAATLVATGGEDLGPPTRLALVDREGRERLGYEALVWERENERWRPRSLRFVVADEEVWTEEFRLVDRRARFADLWFQPPDRRETPGEGLNRQIVTLDLRPGLVRRWSLDGEDLAGALARARAVRDEIVPPPGHRLAEDLRVELDAAGTPRAVAAWMEPWSATPPAGWEAFAGGPALGRWLPGPEAARAGVLAEMIRRAGPLAGEAPRLLLQVTETKSGPASTRLLLLLQGEIR